MTHQKPNLREFLYETSKGTNKISLIPLSFNLDALEPILSKQNVDWHYNVHSKKYVEKANKVGDKFNVAGAVLHNTWWEQLQAPNKDNQPVGAIKKMIDTKYGSFAKFKKAAKEQFMSIQGSGWLMLTTRGSLVTVNNHMIVDNVVLVIDQWEHSFYPTHGPDKEKYIDTIWQCINWNIVNARLDQ